MDKKHRLSLQIFRGKKVLVMGLGLHGGGEATVRWLVKHGAHVTVTDLRDKKTLAPSLSALRGLPIRYVLGEHRAEDFRSHNIIVVSPGVGRESSYLRLARRKGKRIENVASLFFRFLKNQVIGVTGTRGKTTTTLWIAELLKKKYPDVRQSGTPERALLEELERVRGGNIPVVAELSSWQLEYFPSAFTKWASFPPSGKAPHIAAITNVYPEHLNRYRGIRDYADAKANIFKHQGNTNMLVLNHDDPWHRYFLQKKPKSALYYISRKALPKKLRGAYVRNETLMLRIGGKTQKLFSIRRFRKVYGEHNLENLLRAVLVAKLFDPKLGITEREVLRLPTPRMRQEIILKRGKLTVVNDSCATSPDGTIAAIERFRKLGNIVLIAGGTDKKLRFDGLAKEIKKYVPAWRLVLLQGSATTKLTHALRLKNYEPRPLFVSLKECVGNALRIAKNTKEKSVILFSPSAASFEKFLHEFDRGRKFNRLIRRLA